MNELLFDFTLDTYKFSALNTCFLCHEAKEIITYVEKNVIDKKHLVYIIEELNWSIKNDKVGKDLLKDFKKDYFPLNTDVQNFQELKIKVEILLNKLSPRKYLPTTIKLLSIAIANNQKTDICNLSSSLVTTLINIGYHQNYIYYELLNHFNNNRKKVENLEVLNSFFKLFTFEKKKYTVVFRGSKLLSETKNSCPAFKIELSDELTTSKTPKFTEPKTQEDIFISCKEIIAYDIISAKKKAQERVNRLAYLFMYFHHKEIPLFSKNALVINGDNEILVNSQISPMIKTADSKPKKAAEYLNFVIENLSLDKRSFKKFTRAIDLHGQALSSKEVENQILNIWFSFETILTETTMVQKYSR